MLALPYDQVVDDAKLWEFTVLVTNTDYDLEAIGQLTARAVALEQLPGPQRWRAWLACICARITGSATLPTPA